MDDDELNRVCFISGNKVIRFHGYYDNIVENEGNLHAIYLKNVSKYIGTENSFSQIVIDSVGNYVIESKFRGVDDRVSHIAQSSYGDFILAKNTVFHFEEDIARKYSFPGIVDFMTDVNGSTILHDDENGLSIFVGGRFKVVNNSLFLSKETVVEIKSINVGEYIVATKDNGLFVFDGESFIPFAQGITEGKRISAMEVISRSDEDYEVVISTYDNELISIDRSGFQLYKKQYSNQVFDLHYTKKELLYVATSKGIEVFFYSLPFQIVDFTSDPIHGPISIFDNRFYWGSVDGLSYKEVTETNQLSDRRFKVKDTDGKVGKLDIVSNTLLMSHEDGLYDILPKFGARFIPDDKFFNFTELSDNYLVGFGKRKNYLLKKVRSKWVKQLTLDNLPIHPKSIVFDKESTLWLVDRDYNLLSYSFDPRRNEFTELSREENSDKVEVFSVNGQLILLKNHQAYEWTREEFVLSKEFSAVLGTNLDLEQVINDQYGNVWYIENGEVGIFRSVMENGVRTYKKLRIAYPFSDPRSIYPYDKNNVFINNGDYYVKIDLEQYEKKKFDNVVIDRVYNVSDLGSVKNLYNIDRNEELPRSITTKSTNELHITFYNELRPDSQYGIKGENLNEELGEPKYVGSPDVFDDKEFIFRMQDFYGQISSTDMVVDSRKPFLQTTGFWIMLGLINLLLWVVAFVLGYNFKKMRS